MQIGQIVAAYIVNELNSFTIKNDAHGSCKEICHLCGQNPAQETNFVQALNSFPIIGEKRDTGSD